MIRQHPIVTELVQARIEEGALPGHLPFVAISRQAGAGGHSLAKRLIEKMAPLGQRPLYKGWEIFDQKIVDILADEHDLDVSMETLMTQEYHSEMQELLTELFGGPAHQFKLYRKTFELVRLLAGLGKVILIGRASPICTRGMSTGIKVRLRAPEPVRIERMMALLDVDRAKAAALIKKQDRARAKLVKDFFSKDIEDDSLYDMVRDTEKTSIDLIADELIKRIEEREQSINRPPGPS